MGETSVHGIVLRRSDSGESDRRLTLLTQELGKIDVIAKGARKAASRLSGVSEPLCTGVYGLVSGKNRYFVTQAQPVSSFRSMRTDYDRLTFGLALLELYAAVLPLGEQNPDAYELLRKSLMHLEDHLKPIAAFVWAQTALLAISGFQPHFSRCAVCGASVQGSQGRLSPQEGGFLCPDHESRQDRALGARREVLIALEKLGELDGPPQNLRFAPECFNALLPFWRSYAECPLHANEALQKHLYEERLSLIK